MQQIYYTQEGQPYYLKTQTKRIIVDFGGAATEGDLAVCINGAMTGQPADAFRLDFQTDKPIVPVQLCYGCIVLPQGRLADVMSVFYSYHETTFATMNERHLPALAKMSANVERIYYTSADHYAYGIKYNQAVLNTADFIPTTGIVGFKFKNFMADSFDQNAAPVTIPPGVNDCQIGITFLYFELQT